MAEEMLKAIDIATCLGLTTGRVYQLAQDGTIPHVRMGNRSIRFPRATWQAWLAEREEEARLSVAVTGDEAAAGEACQSGEIGGTRPR